MWPTCPSRNVCPPAAGSHQPARPPSTRPRPAPDPGLCVSRLVSPLPRSRAIGATNLLRADQGRGKSRPDQALDQRRVVQIAPSQPHDLVVQRSRRVLTPLLVYHCLPAIRAGVLDQAVELDMWTGVGGCARPTGDGADTRSRAVGGFPSPLRLDRGLLVMETRQRSRVRAG